VQSALTAPCRSSCRTVEDFLDRHADGEDVVVSPLTTIPAVPAFSST
jgi:hypothetical protein